MSNKRLSGKQKAFINAYLGEANFNATHAAKLAGYAGNGVTLATTGYQNIRNPQIAEEISKQLQASAMSANEVLMRLGEQARVEYSKYIDSEGTVHLDTLLADDKGHLIKGIKETKYGRQIEFYDGQSALNTIAKHHGLLTDKLEIKIENELNSALDLLEKNLDKETFGRVLTVLTETG